MGSQRVGHDWATHRTTWSLESQWNKKEQKHKRRKEMMLRHTDVGGNGRWGGAGLGDGWSLGRQVEEMGEIYATRDSELNHWHLNSSSKRIAFFFFQSHQFIWASKESHEVYLEGNTYILKKAMATHSSTLAWKIPWAGEPGGLQSMGSLRVRHDWTTSLFTFTTDSNLRKLINFYFLCFHKQISESDICTS